MTEKEVLEQMSKPFPTLGDPARTFPVELTEPEINAIHSGVGFIVSCCDEMTKAGGPFKELYRRYLEHYGPTLKELSKRLAVFDDKPEFPRCNHVHVKAGACLLALDHSGAHSWSYPERA